MDLSKKMYHGAAYYPEVWDLATVKKDIKVMKKLGINFVRIAEFAWALLEPEEDVFNIGLFDEFIEEFGKNDIRVIMCTPTATPPRWLTKKYPDSLIVDRNMVRAHHGSREHVCFNNPDYIKRTKIICEKLGEHYGKNKYVIAWQLHNEYNCPPVSECLCDNCQNAYREWLKNKYGTIENLNNEWCSGVWSTRYNSFDDVIAPRPTPNGHSASMSTNYTLFTFDSVSKYNKMQADIIHKYSNAPITHNTNKIFHINQEDIFTPLDFATFDNYLPREKYAEICMEVEMCRNLKPGVPFLEMETSCSTSANLHGRWPVHERGFVKAEATNQFFAGSHGISYWLFRQHRGGTEMPHGHIVNSFGTLSQTAVNVMDVSNEIKKLSPFILSTNNKQAPVALLYSDEGRAFVNNETLGGNNYLNDMVTTYESLINIGIYRDIIYSRSSFNGYKVIIVPYVAHLSDELIQKLVKAAENGSTVIVGPYSGWRTNSHGYYVDNCFGPIEQYFASPIVDADHTAGLNMTCEAFGKVAPVENFAAFVNNGIDIVHGGYWDGKSLISEAKHGKGKIVFVGTRFGLEMQEALYKHYIDEKLEKEIEADKGIIIYERADDNNAYICLMNMADKTSNFRVINGTFADYFSNEDVVSGEIKKNEYVILRRK